MGVQMERKKLDLEMAGKRRMRSVGLVQVFLLLAFVLQCSSAQVVSFKEVGREMGLKQREWMDTWRPENNRYYGCTVFDADGDGWYDVAMPNHNDNTEFYFGSPDGFKFRSMRALRNDVHTTAAYDFDSDGDVDLITLRGGRSGQRPNLPIVYEVDGKNRAVGQVPAAKIGINERMRGRATAFFDANGDGLNDLLLINRHEVGKTKAHAIYKNLGNGKFKRDAAPGMEETYAAWFCLADFNRDSYLDVVLMGFGFIEIWMGTGSMKFQQQSWRLPNAGKIGQARACAEIDVNNDGRMELYIARGNGLNDMLLKNKNGNLIDISSRWGLPKGGNHVHVTYLDADNNGHMDVYVSRSTEFTAPRQRDIMLYNTGTTFRIMDLANTGLHLPYHANEDADNATAFDFDNDGRVDILRGDRNSPWKLYRNVSYRANRNWIRVAIGRPRPGNRRPEWNKDPWGALVTVKCGGKKFVNRTGTPGMSHSASNLLRLTFGLGGCNNVGPIRVDYIGGVSTLRWGGPVNREVSIGLLNCPGSVCEKNPPICATKCETSLCEKNIYRGKKVFCPV